MRPENRSGSTNSSLQQVPAEEKARKVAAIFESIADRYDLMNDITSFGMHRLWRRFALRLSGARPGQRVLDLAGGTGDFTARLARVVGPEGQVVLAEINAAMLLRGRALLMNGGTVENVEYVQADAEHLPFSDNYFDCVTIAFGLRNMSDGDAALASVHRVLKPGARIVILEFAQPTAWGFRQLYDLYSFKVLPLMGRLIAGDGDSYQYLAESIRTHPDQQALKGMMEQAGFHLCEYVNLSGGIVAVHRGYKQR
jgi:demethylmenaquinone methyltransferase/2-methoxy-6-polyprenyl-1,4-benzoquinol methylase